jgi:drug/metabolite transporter (DMT)-like permease
MNLYNTPMLIAKDHRRGIHLALANAAGLGLVGLVDKLGSSRAVNPLVFSLQSIFFALVFTSLFALLHYRGSLAGQVKGLSWASWKLMALIGVCSSGLFVLFRFVGLAQSTGTFATLSQVVTTSFTAIFAFFFLKEKLSRPFWILFFTILAAMYFVSIGRLELASLKAGDLFIVAGTFFLAAGNIFSKAALKEVPPVILTVGRFGFGFLFLVAAGMIFLAAPAEFFQPNVYAPLSGFLWGLMIIAFNLAIKKVGVTLATSLLMTAPILTMALEAALIQRSFTAVQVAASLVIVVAGVLIVRTQSAPV